ncbi:hypothetical protein MtrunA17_Chr2g0302151 [Medicago truncatula]|uniref:Transmembrane protein n=1 Tax=Medicago truncatula TaxID=3880 RepID=A0A396JAZ6_MEDTR|nr:hypothetical protein MtrunA17_Chr2g0302151 [Medicago truncatula]
MVLTPCHLDKIWFTQFDFFWIPTLFKPGSLIPVSLVQLVGILHIICRSWGSNPRHSTI